MQNLIYMEFLQENLIAFTFRISPFAFESKNKNYCHTMDYHIHFLFIFRKPILLGKPISNWIDTQLGQL
jgi:hypothetical protein